MGYRTLVVLLLLVFVIGSCGSVSEATSPVQDDEAIAIELATSTPTEAAAVVEPPTSTPTPTATPMVEPEPTEAEAPDTPTPSPAAESAEDAGQRETEEPSPTPEPVEEPTSSPTPTPPPAPQTTGTGGFGNNLATADKFNLELVGVSAPPDGQTYQGWLIADDGTATSVGVFNVGPDGGVVLEWSSPNGENLLSRFAHFQVTLEPTSGSGNPTGQVVLEGGLTGETLTNSRRLFVTNESEPATPLNTAFALGLIAQTDVAVQHVQNAVNATAIGALPETRTHLEHVINILEGAGGPLFGDHDGNGVAENPGDGFGVAGYAGQMAALFSNQPAVVEATANVQTQVAAVQDKALEALSLEDIATVSAKLTELQGLANQLKADAVTQLYQAGQTAVTFEVTPPE